MQQPNSYGPARIELQMQLDIYENNIALICFSYLATKNIFKYEIITVRYIIACNDVQ